MTANSDLAITPQQLQQLIQKFTGWLENNPEFFSRLQHDRYERFRSPDYWRSVSDEELVEEMYQFTRDGGNIQSGGARFAGGFRESLQADIQGFRNLILRLFDEPQPDIDQWWKEIREKFKYFGSGTCSILLHRIFPDRYVVLNVASVVALRRLGLITGTKQLMEKNYARFLEAMKQLVVLSGNTLNLRSSDEMMHFLSNTDEGLSAWSEITGEVLPEEGQRPIWCIRAGEDAKYWEQWKQRGYIAISWPKIGPATGSTAIEEFRKLLIEYYPRKDEKETEHTHRHNAKALDDFINNMTIGDLVVVTGKTRDILGVGKITGEYTYVPDDPTGEQERQRSVTWLKTVPALSSQDFPTKTLTPLEPTYHTYLDVIRYVGDITEHRENLAQPSERKQTLEKIVQLLRHIPNLILYGPPGTGKTFYAQRLVRHLTNSTEMRKYTKSDGVRYWWVTANPAQWDWEHLSDTGEQAFKFGRIARNYRDVREGDIVFGYLSHPHKKISAIARVKTPPEFGEAEGNTIKEMILEPLLSLSIPLLWRDIAADPVLMSSEPVRNGAQGTLFRITDDEAKHVLTLLREAGNELGNLSYGQTKRWEFVTFHQSYSYEQFVEGLTVETTEEGQAIYRIKDGVFKRLARRAQADPEHEYVLIIDEINRGNISKIFGELITLIEKDKRIENSRAAEPERQGIEVTLPYSGEPFGVPANLKIIGTMNTADRSIALLDVALRRRFTFFELVPQYEDETWRAAGSPVEIAEIHLPRLLHTLNDRISKILNRDHRIGHAYLLDVIDVKTLRFSWFYRIVPLISEYLYNDSESLVEVLGDFVRSTDDHRRQYECIDPASMTDEQFILTLRKQVAKR